MHDVLVFPDALSLARAAAQRFVALGQEAIRSRGIFRVALSGGSTPRGMYASIAEGDISREVDWSRVQIFWGDERCVPPEHPDSNYRLAVEAFIDWVHIPSEQVYRIEGELNPAKAAEEYAKTLRSVFGLSGRMPPSVAREQLPRFDLILLGMGSDGHTASLFPGTAAIQEKLRWVEAQFVEHLNAWRVTLTPVVINAARQVLFLVSGAEKAQRLHEVLKGPIQPERLPAQIVQPFDGKLTWMVDAQAATKL